MGTEFGQRREFSEARSVDWEESANWGHRGVQRLIKDMNGIYKEHSALWKRDADPSGFSWIDADDHGGNVFSWLRYDGDGQMIACVTNFSSEPRPDYRIGLPRIGAWKEILNTDASVYDGTGKIGNLGQVIATEIPSHGYSASAPVTIPPLGAVWLRFEPVLDEEQEESEKVSAGVRAAAKQVSPPRSKAAAEAEAEESARPRRSRSRAAAKAGAEEESAVKPEALPTEALEEEGIGAVDETEAATIQPALRTAPRTSTPPPDPRRTTNQT